MIKDHGVPGLPQVPEEQEDDVETHHVREEDTRTNIPRTMHEIAGHRNAKAGPNLSCPMAFREYMDCRFQHSRAVGAPGVIQGSDVPVVKVGMGV